MNSTALWAFRDRACVRAGDFGVGVVFGMPVALDWADGSLREEEGGGFEDFGLGSQYSTTRRAAEKMWDWMIWIFIDWEREGWLLPSFWSGLFLLVWSS